MKHAGKISFGLLGALAGVDMAWYESLLANEALTKLPSLAGMTMWDVWKLGGTQLLWHWVFLNWPDAGYVMLIILLGFIGACIGWFIEDERSTETER